VSKVSKSANYSPSVYKWADSNQEEVVGALNHKLKQVYEYVEQVAAKESNTREFIHLLIQPNLIVLANFHQSYQFWILT